LAGAFAELAFLTVSAIAKFLLGEWEMVGQRSGRPL
jgi:hypothetical protein